MIKLLLLMSMMVDVSRIHPLCVDEDRKDIITHNGEQIMCVDPSIVYTDVISKRGFE